MAQDREKCWKCSGTGIYRWGPVINGKVSYEGPCFRCQGKGYQDTADKRRNWGYDVNVTLRRGV